MKSRTVTATEFKAKCLAILDEVEANRGTVVTITKRGKPVATVQAAKKAGWRSLEGILKGKLEIVGDIINPDPSIVWDAMEGRLDPEPVARPRSPRRKSA